MKSQLFVCSLLLVACGGEALQDCVDTPECASEAIQATPADNPSTAAGMHDASSAAAGAGGIGSHSAATETATQATASDPPIPSTAGGQPSNHGDQIDGAGVADAAQCTLSPTVFELGLPECSECLASRCCSEVNSCAADADCVGIVSCSLDMTSMDGCEATGDDDANLTCLLDACAPEQPSATAHYEAAFACTERACGSECAALLGGG